MVISELTKNVITKYSEPLLKQLIKFNKDEFEKLKIDFDFVFTKYLEKSYEKYSKIKTILYKTEPQYIYDFFEIPSIIKEPNISVNAEDVNNLLDISNFIILQGTGGIGKSTLLKHLFINELEKQDLIPIFFELKDINLIEGEYSIIDVLFNKLENLGSTLKKDYIEYALNSGCFLFFLDGFDEIVSNKKDTFFQKLDAFCDKYTENFFIISSRPFSEFIEFQRFTVLKVLPLSKEQSISLISKINYDNDIKERFIHALEEQLYNSHTSFASNPLLLNIMLLTFDNYADIPEKLHLFYANAFETLYYKHDATKSGYKREMLSTLSYDSFKKVFAYFCFITYIKGTIEFTHEELRELFIKNKILKTEFNVDNYIYDLINSLCVLYKEGFSYSFAHRSFQEYFTAVFLKDLPDAKLQEYGLQMIRQEPSRAYHDNVFDMLHDMIEERYEKNILLPLFVEYEQTIPSSEDKYMFYFQKLVSAIKFDYDANHELRLWLSTTLRPEDNLVKFMNHSVNHSDIVLPISNDEHKESAHKLFEYLTQNHNYKLNKRLNTDILLTDKNILEIISTTWIGSSIHCITNFKDYLTQKIDENERTLDSIFENNDF